MREHGSSIRLSGRQRGCGRLAARRPLRSGVDELNPGDQGHGRCVGGVRPAHVLEMVPFLCGGGHCITGLADDRALDERGQWQP